jgi:hypothetical protein
MSETRLVAMTAGQAQELRALEDDIKDALAPCLGGTGEGDPPCGKCSVYAPLLEAAIVLADAYEHGITEEEALEEIGSGGLYDRPDDQISDFLAKLRAAFEEARVA